MRLGFYAEYSEDTARFAQETGFKCMQLSAWPGSSLDADTVTAARVAQICADLARRDIEISALGYYPNYLDPDPAVRAGSRRYLLKVLDLAKRMGVGVVATFAGRDPDRSLADNIPLFAETFSGLCEEAERRGIRLAIENCPMMDQVHMKSTNIAFSPEVWDAMFEAVPSSALGLELDPAHMVWLGIDYLQAVRDYGHRIYHVHAKDMEIRRDVLGRVGIYGRAFGEPDPLGEHGWWRARMPGWGQVDWPAFITALMEVGYSGNIDIEHEDQVFARAARVGPTEHEADIAAEYGREREGLRLGYNTLSRLIPQ